MSHSKLYVQLMNSREWRELRIRKLQSDPLCQLCMANGKVVSARCIHHILPIEATRSEAEARRRAFDWNNLQSLCYQCHADIHKAERSHSKEVVKQRNDERLSRWADSLEKRFNK